jgi:CPA2 family monovalent cation:H+ antiporter-2
MALLGNYLGLSAAAGAFLMGALVGDTEHSEEITEVVVPVRDMFAALFFVTIGMLINITEFRDFIIPALIISAVFILGKILSNTLAIFVSGQDGKTSLEVGMGMPIMGEFSLAIAKMGIDRGVVLAPLYPVIATTTTLTSFVAPYIARSTNSVANFLDRRSPALLKAYVLHLADWLQALRSAFARDSEAAQRIRHSFKVIMVNLLIVIVVIGIGTFALHFVEELALLIHIRADIIGLLFGILILVLCIPSFVIIWRSLRVLVDEASVHVLRRRPSAKHWRREALRIVLRDSIMTVLSIFVLLWLVPLMVQLFFIGSFSVAVPAVLIAAILLLVLDSARQVHSQLERAFSHTLLDEEYISTSEAATRLGISQSRVAELARKMKLPAGIPHREYPLYNREMKKAP